MAARRRVWNVGWVALSAWMMAGCVATSPPASESDDSRFRVVATTSQIADALQQVLGPLSEEIEITRLCGPGVDPHSFSPSVADVRAMESADLIIFNGFHLEAKLDALLQGRYAEKSWSMAGAFPESARLAWVEDGQTDPSAPFDPHIWNHLEGWAQCVRQMASTVAAKRPEKSDAIEVGATAYLAEIQAIHVEAKSRFAAIPRERRVLVSSHDAFNYFADVYGFDTLAVLGIGNDAEADVATMRQVAETVADREVPVIFLESITNPKIAQSLREAAAARGWQVRIADRPLYSDDLGSEPPTDTFLGAFQHNVDLIAESLTPSAATEVTTKPVPARQVPLAMATESPR